MVICDETGTPCQHGNDCLLRGACRLIPNNGLGNLIASQPYSTNQEPAAPSLEQPADSEFVLLQDDCWVAGASGPRQDALREILHYATVYGQDGPVKVYEVKRTLIPHE